MLRATPRHERSEPDNLSSTVERLAASLREEQLFSIARIYGGLVDVLEWCGGIATALRRRRH